MHKYSASHCFVERSRVRGSNGRREQKAQERDRSERDF